jgi:RHS repeat-associated protein
VLDESDLSGNQQEEYVYFGGQKVARRDIPANTVHYYFSDHLGSASAVTDSSGVIQKESDYYPFGGEIAVSGTDSNNYKFTGKERDTESGLDNFGARYNASSVGRFMSPDPSKNLVLRAINPQRWNQYTYAINNPINYVDNDGRDAAAVNFSGMVGGLGHVGLLVINKDGTASYTRFGPEDHSLGNLGGASGTGAVLIYNNIPSVQFGSNGLPTDASVQAVADAVAQDESTPGSVVDPSTVRINYFQTGSTDTGLLNDWAQLQQEHSQNGQGPFGRYCVTSNNCATFTAAGLVAGGAITAEQARGLSVDPNRMFNQLSRLANDNFDLLQMQIKPPEKACVTIYGPDGPETHCE